MTQYVETPGCRKCQSMLVEQPCVFPMDAADSSVATKDDVSSFPDVGEVTEKLNDFCEPPRMEAHSNWGFTKKMGYENSGWCCAEFAIAKRNGTIVNMDDAPVQRVLKSREWPNTATEYAAMMESKEQPVHFTKKGDAEAVRFNFFKNAYSLIGED